MKRDEETKYIVKGYLRFKCALIVMLYSYSEALAEIKTEKKKRPNHIKHVNYTTSVRLASKKSWSIMQCATL
jgi:hypothetical protein